MLVGDWLYRKHLIAKNLSFDIQSILSASLHKDQECRMDLLLVSPMAKCPYLLRTDWRGRRACLLIQIAHWGSGQAVVTMENDTKICVAANNENSPESNQVSRFFWKAKPNLSYSICWRQWFHGASRSGVDRFLGAVVNSTLMRRPQYGASSV